MRAEFDVKTKSEVFLMIDVFIGTVPVTKISTTDPEKISTTAAIDMLGGTRLKKYMLNKLLIVKCYVVYHHIKHILNNFLLREVQCHLTECYSCFDIILYGTWNYMVK